MFKSHIKKTVESTVSSETPKKENNQTATPPRITTSSTKNEGIRDTKRYIVKSEDGGIFK